MTIDQQHVRRSTARLLNDHFILTSAGRTGNSSSFLYGWLACAIQAGAIDLTEKCDAECAIRHNGSNDSINEWWRTEWWRTL